MTEVGASSSAAQADLVGTARTAALLDALFANVTPGIAFWDCELRFERVNEELAAINGVPVGEHLGRRPSEVLPELGERLEPMLQGVLDSGEPVRDVDIEGETLAAPGVTRHWRATYFPVRDAEGKILGVAALVLEVTGERRAHVRADRARQRSDSIDAELQALYAALPVGVAFLSPDLRYQRVNETLAVLNGRSVDEHIGASLEEVLGESAVALKPALERVLSTGQPLDIEVSMPLPRDQNDVRALEATYFPVADGSGELLGVGGVVRDVTRPQELEIEQSRLLREALLARAQAEAARVRADDAREEAERAREPRPSARRRGWRCWPGGARMAESMDWETTLRAVVPQRRARPSRTGARSRVVEPDGGLRVVAVAHRDPERERLAWELAERYPPDPDAAVGVGARRSARASSRSMRRHHAGALRAAARPRAPRAAARTLDLRHIAIAPLATPRGVIGALTFVLRASRAALRAPRTRS